MGPGRNPISYQSLRQSVLNCVTCSTLGPRSAREEWDDDGDWKPIIGGEIDEMLWRNLGLRAATVLIVHHDRIMRGLVCGALLPKYQIVQASSVEEAVRTAARHEKKIDLLVTEILLPDFYGWELMDLLKLDYPNLKAVYTSSSMDDEIRARIRPWMVVVLTNPFRGEPLRQAVREVLEGRKGNRVDSRIPAVALHHL
jgi:CheY-like chemotaxis protein